MSVDRMLTPSGRPYAPGTITAKVYVLKESDEWLADESETGAIWSGGLGKIKSNQHPQRFILDQNGTVLRPPLAAPGVCPARWHLSRCRQGGACHRPAPDRRLAPPVPLAVLDPADHTRQARLHEPRGGVAGAKTHGDHVVMCWVTAVHISRKGADVEGFLRVGMVTCRVTPEQHAELSYLPSKPHMADLPDAMRAAGSPEQLLELGWERYRQGEDQVVQGSVDGGGSLTETVQPYKRRPTSSASAALRQR